MFRNVEYKTVVTVTATSQITRAAHPADDTRMPPQLNGTQFVYRLHTCSTVTWNVLHLWSCGLTLLLVCQSETMRIAGWFNVHTPPWVLIECLS